MSKANIFNTVKMTKPNRNRFDLSHDVKLSANMGNLTPTLVMECIPGDKFHIGCQSLLRFAPLVAPVMHRVDVTMHYFFVPNRLLWQGWEDYVTNTKSGGALPAFPTIAIGAGTGTTYTKLMDYMGIPPQPSGMLRTHDISALPFAAFQLIWNEYYRDQNMQTDISNDLFLADGAQSPTVTALLTTPRNRAWEHDYFTAALPFAQKGDPVSLPLGTFDDVPVQINTSGNPPTTTFQDQNAWLNAGSGPTPNATTAFNPAFGTNQMYAQSSNLVTQAATINDLRTAFRLQEWLEKAARAGSRYTETILSHFGVHSSDKRLQRPEYITGTKSPVVISEVLNTTGTNDAPQGSMAGHGAAVTHGGYGSYYCEEHGLIIGIQSVMPKTAYQDGIERHWFKTTDPFQLFWPEFANLGEQAIQAPEIFAYSNSTPEDFGYIPRYAEYKYMNNRVAGDFRSTLDFWTMARKFNSPPTLSAAFIESDPTFRCFAVTDPDVDHLWCQVLHIISASRAMPKFGTPTF